MVICIDKNRKWLEKKGKIRYSGILFPEIFNLFQFSTHEAYFLFEKGKSILFFPKKERSFFQQSIKEIKNKTAFLERNIISVKFTPETLLFINETKMDYFFDKKFSENLWLHRSNADFIYQHLNDDLNDWTFSLKNRVFYKKLKKSTRIYLTNEKNKTIYNQLVSAEIINNLGFEFYFGKKQTIGISQEKISELKDLLETKKISIDVNETSFYFLFSN